MVSDLCFELAEGGRSVEVVTSRQRYDDPEAALAIEELIRGVRVHRLWTSLFGRQVLGLRAIDYLTFHLNAFRFLLTQIQRGDVVVAKTDPPLISIVAGVAARMRGATLINWLQDLFPETAVELGVRGVGWLAPFLSWLRNISLRAAAMNVAIGGRMAERLASLGVPERRIRVIHNWADGGAICPTRREVNPLRAEWGLDGKFVVGYSGNLGRAHEFETMVNAADLLRARNDVVFLFIGSGANRERLERKARELGLGNVHFHPYQPREKLGLSLTVPDVHLVSLRPELEGLIVPSKFYGIAAAGRPTLAIGDPEGEIPTILRRYDIGYTVMPGDAEGLAVRIVELADNPDLCSTMGTRAREVFEQQFDLPHAMQAWRECLDAVESEIRSQVEHRAGS